MNKGFFLDRDGVINIDHGYVHKIEDFHFIEGIFELTREAIKKGYLVFVITNQAGIGRGLYNVSDFNILTDWMCNKFVDQGVIISKVYFSPYHSIHGKGKYKKDHNSRKPNSGMIYQAVEEYNIDLSKSVLIGDKFTDIEAGVNAGTGTNILFEKIKTNNISELNYCSIESLDDAKIFLKDD